MSAPEELVVTLTADDETWSVDLFDFTGREWRSMKEHVPGITMAAAVAGCDAMDAEVFAVLLWAWRHRDEPELTFDDCLDAISLKSVITTKAAAVDDEGLDDPSG